MNHNDSPKFKLLVTCDNLAQIFGQKRTINFNRKLITDPNLKYVHDSMAPIRIFSH